MKKDIAVLMPTGSTHGWGVCGEALVAALEKHARVIIPDTRYPANLEMPTLQAIQGINMLPLYPDIVGSTAIGYTAFENDILLEKFALNAERHFSVVAATSEWCGEALRRSTRARVAVIQQGVDLDLFSPSTNGTFSDPDYFTVFSGGKWEFRKGQDIVCMAVREMRRRHNNVRICAAWFNPWPETADTMRASQYDYNSALRGIEVIGPWDSKTEHAALPNLMRQCNVALFPNRCEGGTNLVMMEAMACGVPVLATYATGHKDVLRPNASLLLHDNKPFVWANQSAGEHTLLGNWVEPDLDEVIERLEYAYDHRHIGLPMDGEADRKHIEQFTWDRTARAFLDLLP